MHFLVMFAYCSYFISCSKVMTLLTCAAIYIKLQFWCLIVNYPCFLCYSYHGMKCSLLCVLWCHDFIFHDMVVVYKVIELAMCYPAVSCHIPWISLCLDYNIVVLHDCFLLIHGSYDHKCLVWTDHHHVYSMFIYSMVMLLLIWHCFF